MTEMEAALLQRLNTLESELQILRARSHDYGNALVEQKSQLEDTREDIRDLKTTMGMRFDKLSDQAWKIAGFVVTVVMAAAVIVGLIGG